MSYPKHQVHDDEPVTRRGKSEIVAEGWDTFSFRKKSSLAPPQEETTNDWPSRSGKVPRKTGRNRALSSRTAPADRWIVKRGHMLSYVGLFLFTTVLYFRPYELFPSLAPFSSMAQVLAIATLVLYLPSQVMLEGNLTARPREVNLLLLLTLAALLSIPLSTSPKLAWETFNEPFLKVVLMFIVMINVVRTASRLNWLIVVSLAVSCYLSVNALDNYQAGNFTVEGYRVEGGVGGMFANPNDMALHLVTMTPVAIALMFATRHLALKIVFGACALLMLAGNVVTFSRGGFIGLVCALAIVAWKIGRRNHVAVIICGVIILVAFVALAPGNYGERLLSVFDSGLDPVGSSSMRRQLLIRSILVAIRHPLLGVGIGNFPIFSIHDHVSHNAFTQVAAELGMAALAVYVLFILTPLKHLRRIETETLGEQGDARYYHYLSIGLQAGLIGYMVASFFASVAFQWYVYYLVGYAVCLRRIFDVEYVGAKADEKVRPPTEERATVAGLGDEEAVATS